MVFRSSNRQTIAPMSSEPVIGSRWPSVPHKRRRRGAPTQCVGDVYLKKLTIKPREHWPQWVVTRIGPNEDGIMHATLALVGSEATTRRMSTSVLDEEEDWELLHRAEPYTEAGSEA